MNFLSLNVCGIRDANKRMSLMQLLSHCRLDIVCLQETHAVSASESSAWFSPYGFLTVSAVGSARARGLAILYRPRLILNRSWVELCGRFSMPEFMNGNFLFRVVCIYAPNSNPERNSYEPEKFMLSSVEFLCLAWRQAYLDTQRQQHRTLYFLAHSRIALAVQQLKQKM